MHLFFKTILLLAILNTMIFAKAQINTPIKNSFKVLCYHNVVDKITDPKIMNVTTDQLISHFKWLKVNGYHVISLDDILQARKGEKNLPKKAVLLTFDDGYVSFYTRIYPLLKLYNYHAIYALVGKWQETPKNQKFLYGTLPRSRKMLLSWDEINEMKDSGLIEFASHTYDAHHGIIANPQGNTQPAITSLKYDMKTKKYESTYQYQKRVEEDIKKSSDVIYKHTGKRPRCIAWPYGAYNGTVQKIAAKYGMPISLTLDDGSNTPRDIAGIKRILVGNNSAFSDFYWNMQNSEPSPQRILFVNLDELYDKDPKKADKKLGRIIEKIRTLGVSTVVLKAYYDSNQDGYADMLYFPNSIMPMRADLLNRAAWQINSRGKIEDVYVQMPISAFTLNHKHTTLENQDDQRKIMQIYADMAKFGFFKGILFDYRHSDFTIRPEDTMHFTKNLIQSMRAYSIHLKSSIMIDAKKVTHPEFKSFLAFYHRVMLDTSALLSKSRDQKTTLTRLVNRVQRIPHALQRSAFILTNNTHTKQAPTKLMETLLLHKAMNFGYHPNDILDHTLNTHELIKVFSLKSSPFE